MPTFGANQSTWYFSATVRQFENSSTPGSTTVAPQELANAGITVGTAINGQFTYDLNAPDTFASPDRGIYTNIVAAHVSVGAVDSHFNQTVNDFLVTTPNFFPDPARSGLDVLFGLTDSQGLDVILGDLQLHGSDGTNFQTDALPALPPALASLSGFDPSVLNLGTRFVIGFSLPSGLWSADAELQTVFAVPEPSTISIVLVAFAVAIPRRRRSTSHNRV